MTDEERDRAEAKADAATEKLEQSDERSRYGALKFAARMFAPAGNMPVIWIGVT